MDPAQSVLQQVEAAVLASQRFTPTLDTVADQLCMTGRTLGRRLAKSGTSFRTILTDVRARLARDYLLETSMSAKQVAYRLGYSSHTNFYAAFRQWYGCTPRHFRKYRV